MTTAAAGPASPAERPFADATPAQIRAALTPEDVAAFDRQWRTLMQQATKRLDLTEVHQALDAWRKVAWVTSAHGADAYQRTLRSAAERLHTGERGPDAVPWHQLKAELGLHD